MYPVKISSQVKNKQVVEVTTVNRKINLVFF